MIRVPARRSWRNCLSRSRVPTQTDPHKAPTATPGHNAASPVAAIPDCRRRSRCAVSRSASPGSGRPCASTTESTLPAPETHEATARRRAGVVRSGAQDEQRNHECQCEDAQQEQAFVKHAGQAPAQAGELDGLPGRPGSGGPGRGGGGMACQGLVGGGGCRCGAGLPGLAAGLRGARPARRWPLLVGGCGAAAIFGSAGRGGGGAVSGLIGLAPALGGRA
jgi:hypothetical protein